ncbi:hypothetical protein IV498_13515 [Paenarthrobacter sp. Z7-10]|uniref:hypothetical protein n=1 Tax=Paenarthrobacter sp. Z7-10 TaxID=2787635 RepID=UPI0022A91873|nr:hypothetical protein [Paenarthrobacter sp. Z7-10]MCZ2404169.1 hypothetical protein [Paenarthrobacter sp. Z7-10]
MPWWSWIVIWIALAALSLAYVLLLGIRVWRGFSAMLKSFEDTGNQLEEYRDRRAAELAEELDHAQPDQHRPLPGAAVFASPQRLREDYAVSKAARQSERRRQRVHRRAVRGQRQSLRDTEMA